MSIKQYVTPLILLISIMQSEGYVTYYFEPYTEITLERSNTQCTYVSFTSSFPIIYQVLWSNSLLTDTYTGTDYDKEYDNMESSITYFFKFWNNNTKTNELKYIIQNCDSSLQTTQMWLTIFILLMLFACICVCFLYKPTDMQTRNTKYTIPYSARGNSAERLRLSHHYLQYE